MSVVKPYIDSPVIRVVQLNTANLLVDEDLKRYKFESDVVSGYVKHAGESIRLGVYVFIHEDDRISICTDSDIAKLVKRSIAKLKHNTSSSLSNERLAALLSKAHPDDFKKIMSLVK